MVYPLRITLCVFYTAALGILAMAVSLVDRSGESVISIARVWVRWILATCRVRVVAEGVENLALRSPVVFMSNHQSLFDIPALIFSIPVSWRFVAKKELVWIPIFGWALKLAGHVIIDRQHRSRAAHSLARAAERIRRGTNVIIFPEGTRSETGRLREFKSGGFHLAIRAQVPILPVTVSGSHRIAPKRSLRIESGTIKVTFGKPIPTRGLTPEERGLLKERVAEAICAGYDPALQQPVVGAPGAAAAPARSSA